MWNQVRKFFAPPTFPDDEDKTRKARYANAIDIAFLFIAFAYQIVIRIFFGYRDFSAVDLIIFSLIVLCVVGLLMLRRGYVFLTSVLLVVLIWGAVNGIAATGYGARDASFITNFTVVLMAGLLLGWQASLVITVLSIFSGLGLAFAEQNGLIGNEAYPITSFAQDISFVFGFNIVMIYLLINGLENALRRSRVNLEKLEIANVDLIQTQSDLQARSSELTITNQQLENRTEKLRAIAEITSTAASINNFESLVASIAHIIGEQLKYDHVGVFLLDEQRQHVILRSASSEGGSKILARGYRLPVGQKGAVGFVSQTGQAQIAQQDDILETLLANPELPETRSQMALPLKSGNQVIGVLDLQSKEANLFSSDDLYTLSILADQIGIAIQNARVYEQAQRALREANVAFLHASDREWKDYTETVQTKGFRYDGIKPEPLKESQRSAAEDNSLAIPVQLRGQTIGQLKLKPSDSSREWTEDEIAITQAVAERAALALEGARLLDDAQKRASREAFLSGIASKLSTSFQLDSILRDTVEELGQTMQGSTISFQLVNPSAPISPESSSADEKSTGRKKSE